MIFSRIVLFLNGGLHLYFGIVFIVNPAPLMESLAIASTSPVGVVEMRTFYGGLMSAIGIFYFLGIFFDLLRVPALIFATLTYGAAVTVRLWGMIADQALDSSILWRILVIEAFGLILCVAALIFQKKTARTEDKDS